MIDILIGVAIAFIVLGVILYLSDRIARREVKEIRERAKRSAGIYLEPIGSHDSNPFPGPTSSLSVTAEGPAHSPFIKEEVE